MTFGLGVALQCNYSGLGYMDKKCPYNTGTLHMPPAFFLKFDHNSTDPQTLADWILITDQRVPNSELPKFCAYTNIPHYGGTLSKRNSLHQLENARTRRNSRLRAPISFSLNHKKLFHNGASKKCSTGEA